MKIGNISSIDNLVEKLKQIQYEHSNHAQRTVNLALVSRNWFFGYYIVEFENGSATTNLKLCRNFYLNYPEIGQTASDQSLELILDRFKLTWSHYIVLLSIKNTEERNFYEIESIAGNWSLRELKRQFNSSLYERLILSQNKKSIELSKRGQVLENPQDLLKDPYVLEFLNIEEKATYSESDLESAIIDKLEHFLLELGKGFLFEARQKRFSFDEEHFFVDLVFYNRLLRAYVLIDLKIGELKHQDLGQMQMYVNYFDRFVKQDFENKTVGIIICKKKKDSLVEITLPENSNIHASEYKLYLPSKDEFKKQIEEAQF